MTVIEITGLKKTYHRLRGGDTPALDGLDLAVPAGGVFGFLGPNGSGKTTTIRCLLGLSRASGGSCRVLGATAPRGLPEVMDRIGSLVEAPALFPGFSGRRNLELLAAMRSIGKKRVDEVLELVGLAERQNHLVKGYSLGMRQRLAIAAALLKDPELLVLDEPANGLDPAGIREIRNLLRKLGNEGRTVLVSSHILSEVQQMCDQVAIISKGRTITSGPVTEVLSAGRRAGLLVRAEPVADAQRVMEQRGWVVAEEDGGLIVQVEAAAGAEVNKLLADNGIYLHELRPLDVDLETVFLDLTGEDATP